MKIGIGLGLSQRRGGGGSPAFSPAALFASGEQGAWYDPSPTTCFTDTARTTPATVGDPVAGMTDLSGRGNHATQSTLANRPALRQSGSLYYLEFDGVNDGMVTPTITPGVDKVQVFAGLRKLSDAALGIALELGSASSNVFFLAAPRNPAAGNYSFRTAGTTAAESTAAGFAAPITNVLTGISDISGDVSRLRVNGSQVGENLGDQGSGNYSNLPLYIGARAGSSLFFSGHMYSLTARFGPNLTSDQIAAAEAYTAGKTGVTL